MKIELAPSLDKFVAEKIKNGDYMDAAEVIRDSLRRWKVQEDCNQLVTYCQPRIQRQSHL